jgi:hypothetical protein
MRRPKLIVGTFAIWLLICFSSEAEPHAQDATRATPKQLVFSATPSAKGVRYKLDDTIVSDPLRGFGKAIEKYGDELPVICLIDSRLPIYLVAESAATAGKAGFKNVRSFAVDHSTGKVSEIKLGPWVSAPQ